MAGIMCDPNDDMIVACAVKGRAQYIVTRDKDLLSMHSYQGVIMSSPEAFRMLLRTVPPAL
jgi:predicted nucleic acid-binding protein